MKIDEAKYEGGWLMLKCTAADTRKYLYSFKPGEYEIERTKKRRSLNANAYAWALMGQIASMVGVPVEEVYRHCMKDVGGHTAVLTINRNALHAFMNAFKQNHIGRSVDIIGERDGAVDVLITYGSSDYDARQMSQLIDSIVQECKALGIETLEDAKLRQIIEDWEAHG